MYSLPPFLNIYLFRDFKWTTTYRYISTPNVSVGSLRFGFIFVPTLSSSLFLLVFFVISHQGAAAPGPRGRGGPPAPGRRPLYCATLKIRSRLIRVYSILDSSFRFDYPRCRGRSALPRTSLSSFGFPSAAGIRIMNLRWSCCHPRRQVASHGKASACSRCCCCCCVVEVHALGGYPLTEEAMFSFRPGPPKSQDRPCRRRRSPGHRRRLGSPHAANMAVTTDEHAPSPGNVFLISASNDEKK
uniref:Uncharacterized protein n=1 Tax=Triticum urartu TaxID=4572 RepID=A0A8R7UCP4_TRIUA